LSTGSTTGAVVFLELLLRFVDVLRVVVVFFGGEEVRLVVAAVREGAVFFAAGLGVSFAAVDDDAVVVVGFFRLAP
jgi:hypothetical protein